MIGDSRQAVMDEVSRRGLVSIMNDTKWSELQNAVRQELLFPPPYQIKYVLNDTPEPELFSSDNEFWGDWSNESFYPYFGVEWVRVCPRSLRRRGRRVGPDGWSVESHLLRVLHRYHIAYRHDGESVWVYGYAPQAADISPNGVEAAPPIIHPLAESEHYTLGHIRETVIHVDKATGSQTVIGNHSDDPQAGVISLDESWAVSGGEGVLCHGLNGETMTYFRPGFPPYEREQSLVRRLSGGSDDTSSRICVHGLRLDNRGNVRVLLRPWAPYASVWQIDLTSRSVSKLREGPFLPNTWWRWTEY